MSRIIFYEPAWDFSVDSWRLIEKPPTGYEFVTARPPEERLINAAASQWHITDFIAKTTAYTVPGTLIRSWLQRWRKQPKDTALTYAFGHPVFRPVPWVVEVECASLLVGSHPKQLRMFGGILERLLASLYCKKILCWSEAGRRTLTLGLRSEKFEHKIELVHSAVPPRPFVKEYGQDNVKLFFVGSGTRTRKRVFETKGGRELLEAFVLLRQRYDNLELVVRSDMPADLKAQYGGMEGLRLIDKVVPWQILEREFQSADIAVLPNYQTTPHTILDAMSYELPVVGRNMWATPEYIQEGKTGLLVQPAKKVPYYYRDTPHPNFLGTDFVKAVREPDPEVVKELANKMSLLIENPELRRRLGKAGRWEVEHGKFSIKARNDKLKRIFDEVTTPEIAEVQQGGRG